MKKRKKEGEKRHILDDSTFEGLVTAGSILLDHRPFRNPETPRYGFDRQALLLPTKPTYTEIHSSLIVGFRQAVVDRPTLLIGVLASEATQRAGIETRQGAFNDGVATDTRLSLSEAEIEEIRSAHNAGLIDRVVNYDPDNRTTSEQQIISSVHAFIEGFNV